MPECPNSETCRDDYTCTTYPEKKDCPYRLAEAPAQPQGSPSKSSAGLWCGSLKLREIALHDPTVADYLAVYEITERASWMLTMEALAIQLAEEKAELLKKVFQLEAQKAP